MSQTNKKTIPCLRLSRRHFHLAAEELESDQSPLYSCNALKRFIREENWGVHGFDVSDKFAYKTEDLYRDIYLETCDFPCAGDALLTKLQNEHDGSFLKDAKMQDHRVWLLLLAGEVLHGKVIYLRPVPSQDKTGKAAT